MNLNLMEFILEIKDGAYLINLEEYSNMGTHLIALHALSNNVT